MFKIADIIIHNYVATFNTVNINFIIKYTITKLGLNISH